MLKVKRVDALVDVERVEHEDVVIVLRQGDHVAFGGDLESAAARHLDVRAFELGDERSGPGEYGHVETVAVRVADEHVPGIRDVDPVREVGYGLASDAAHVLAFFVEHHYAVTLFDRKKLASRSRD